MVQSQLKEVGALAWLSGVLLEAQTIMLQFPVISFLIVGAAGAFAAGAFAVEAGTSNTHITARLMRALFACLLLAFLWGYFAWPLPLGLVVAGVVSVYPQQMMDWARDMIKAIGEARARSGKGSNNGGPQT
jgi:hypothetical protein